MNKCILLFLLLASNLFAANFQLEEKAFTIGTDLNITKGGSGVIEERTISIGRTFEIKGQYACRSETKVFALGTSFTISVDGHPIAIIEKQVVESMFTFMGNVFVIKDPQGGEIARSELTRGLRPTIRIKESNGSMSILAASGWRYYTWDIVQDPNSKLDPRILFIIAASKTAKDNEK